MRCTKKLATALALLVAALVATPVWAGERNENAPTDLKPKVERLRLDPVVPDRPRINPRIP